jgi:hypothetical protein
MLHSEKHNFANKYKPVGVQLGIKRSAFTIFLREEHRSGATNGGKLLGYLADHQSQPRKTG